MEIYCEFIAVVDDPKCPCRTAARSVSVGSLLAMARPCFSFSKARYIMLFVRADRPVPNTLVNNFHFHRAVEQTELPIKS